MAIHGSYNNQACGPCGEAGEGGGTAESLFRGNFPSLYNLSTSQPHPPPGSYAFINVPGAADDLAIWDTVDGYWRNNGQNNRARIFGLGITDAPYPSNGILTIPDALIVFQDEIIILSLIRILPPPAGTFNSVHTKERYLWAKGKGAFLPVGNVTIGTDILYIGNEKITADDISNIPNTVTRNIGEIPEGESLDHYINNLGPADLIDLTDNTKTYFLSFVQDGQSCLAAFAGAGSAHGFGWYGSSTFGGFQATPGDFNIIGSPAGPDIIPTLQQVNADGNGTTDPLTVKHISGIPKSSLRYDRILHADSSGITTEYLFDPLAEDWQKVFARLGDILLSPGSIIKAGKGFTIDEGGEMVPNTGTMDLHEKGDVFKGLTLLGKLVPYMRYKGTGDVNDFANHSYELVINALLPDEPGYIAPED